MLGIGQSARGVFVGICVARDADRIAGLKQFQRGARINSKNRVVDAGVARRVGVTPQKLVAELDLLFHAGCVGAQHVFRDHEAARLGDGEVRLCRDYQPEGL